MLPSLTLWFCICLSLLATSIAAQDAPPHFASGIKAGECTQDSAIVWVRATENEQPDFDKLSILTEGLDSNENPQVEMPVDVVPGVDGELRVQYQGEDESVWSSTDWASVNNQTDFTHQFHLSGLEPGINYSFVVQARISAESPETRSIQGEFKTAPAEEDSVPVRFIVSTCQAVRSIDSGADGHVAYQQMLNWKPDFFVHTGDILYYDKAPFCKNMAAARAKWNLMFAYGHNRRFHQNVTSYFMKDDHDTLKNDCWPGQKYGELTFEQGLALFREQVCIGESTCRTIRWGRDVQIWLTENRDFRSANNAVDGPSKTILGEKQKGWLIKTLAESNATFKIVISPGPIVGPDKKGKADNHSNAAFAHEGQELRDVLSAQPNTYVICGDRHWQYCSKDPKTGLIEMGCGPINDQHSFGGNPGYDKTMHRYFGAKGGFLGITIEGDSAKAEWFHSGDVDTSGKPNVLHVETFEANSR